MRLRFAIFALALALAPAIAVAEPIENTAERLSDPTEQAAHEPHKTSFVALPVPISDPAIGTGLGAGAIVLYRPDANSPPWSTGIGGLYTDSESWGAAIFQRAHFNHDRIRLSAIAGYADFNLDFFGIGSEAGERGISIGLEQKGAGVRIDTLMQVAPHFYLGVRYRGAHVDSTFDTSELFSGLTERFPDLEVPDLQLESTISALGISSQYDSRDSEYAPRKGLLGEANLLFADESIGSDFTYPRLEAALNGYHSLGKTVLAWRGSMCWAGDDAPFFDLCNYGSQNDLRGYPIGQFRDHTMVVAQAEIRQPLFWRFGAVAFAGVGAVAPSAEEINTLLPAVGVGLRFEASRSYRVNLGLDYAVGDGTSAIYFRIGEAF